MSDTSAALNLTSLRRLDSQTISDIYDLYFAEIFKFVRYRVNDDLHAEDIASETFIRLMEAVNQSGFPHSNLRGWLYATASHMVTDHFRRSYRRPVEALDDQFVDDDALNPLAVAEQSEEQVRLKKALQTLTEEQQSVLSLRFGQGLSLDESAAILNKNVNAIKQLQFRALAALNRQLGAKP